MVSSTDRERQRLSPAWLGLAAVVATISIYGAAIAIGGIGDTWALMLAADPTWLIPAALAEAVSCAGWVVLLKTVADDERVSWGDSVRITLAGVAATRLLAAGAPEASRSPSGRCGAAECRWPRPRAPR